MRRWTAKDLILTSIVGAVAALVMYSHWGPPALYPDPDALFYQAQAEEIRGEPRLEALHSVFASNLAGERQIEREGGLPASQQSAYDPEWIDYSARFYRRRWTIPLAAAAITPISGDTSLEFLSLTGYVVMTMLMFLLLRFRFDRLVSVGVTLAIPLLPPVRNAAAIGTTDTWGLALMIASLIVAIVALERGRRWVAAWFVLVLALSFTRDLTIVVVIAAIWVALCQRTRTAVGLAFSGFIASLPAPLIAGAPLQQNLAYVIDGYQVPTDSSWNFILAHYPHQLWSVVSHDFTYPLDFAFPLPMLAGLLAMLAGVVALIVVPSRGDPYFQLMQAALVGGAITILISVNFTEWRLELAMLPPIAVGVALLAERILRGLYDRISRRRIHAGIGAGPPTPQT